MTGKKILRSQTDYCAYLMILPFYIIFLTIYLLPIFETIFNSFTNSDMFSKNDFIGLENYINAFSDEYFLVSIKNTILYVIITVTITMVVGLLFSVIMNSKLVKTKYARTGLFLPHIASMVSVSIIWIWLYDPTKGIFNFLLESVGLNGIEWLSDPKFAMLSIVMMSIWKGIGYNMLINLTGLQSIPEMYYEAATMDGANKIQSFFHITIPLLTPTTFFLFTTCIISSFNVFEQVNVMTGGGPLNVTTTVVHQIYTRAFTQYQMGYASAQSVIALLIISFFILLSFRFGKKGDDLDIG